MGPPWLGYNVRTLHAFDVDQPLFDPILKFNNYFYDYIQTLGIGMLCIFNTIDVLTYVLT
jgi:hypothetical protein